MENMNDIPNPNEIFPNEYKTSCFIKNVVKAPNITVGDYTYYDDDIAPTEFERNNVLFNYPEFGDKLVIGKFCQIAKGMFKISVKNIAANFNSSFFQKLAYSQSFLVSL